jgi:hypothetical protein
LNSNNRQHFAAYKVIKYLIALKHKKLHLLILMKGLYNRGGFSLIQNNKYIEKNCFKIIGKNLSNNYGFTEEMMVKMQKREYQKSLEQVKYRKL